MTSTHRPAVWSHAIACAFALALVVVADFRDARASAGVPFIGTKQISTVVPLIEMTTDYATGFEMLTLEGLPELPNAQFSTADLTPATMSTYAVPVDPTPQTPLAIPGSQAAFTLVPLTFYGDPQFESEGDPRLLIVEVPATTAPELRLFVGADSNADSAPQDSEVLCESNVTAGANARCVVDLATTIQSNPNLSNLWIAVDIPTGTPGQSYSVTLYSAEIHVMVSLPGGYPANTRQVVSGPGHVPAASAFPLRYSWTAINPMFAGQRYYSAIFVDPAPTSGSYALGSAQIVPFSITRNSAASDDVPFVAAPYDVATGYIAFPMVRPGESLTHAFIDVPPNATALSVGAGHPFSVVRADYPQSASSPAIGAFPSGATLIPAQPANANGGYAITIPSSAQVPGRWYIVVSGSNLGEETQVVLNSAITFGGGAPTLTPGNYFNPQRSGHGIFISQASGSQVVTWYAYLEDGTPTWYFVQGQTPAVNQTVWTAPMYRASWNGSAISAAVPVGLVVITTIGPNELIFSYNLEGRFGSERMVLLSSSSCPSLNGMNTNLAGNWFAPAQSGYGIDVLAGPDFQFDVFYLYDALGLPRWVVGQAAFSASTAVSMNQSNGFCPACNYTPIQFQQIGVLNIQYQDGTSGQMSTNFDLITPLSGSFDVSQPTYRLTGSPGC